MKYKFTDSTNTVVTDGNGWSGLVTCQEVQAWLAEGNTPEPADPPPVPNYSELRAQAYREESDPLFFQEQRGEVPAGTWLAKVNEIKARLGGTS